MRVKAGAPYTNRWIIHLILHIALQNAPKFIVPKVITMQHELSPTMIFFFKIFTQFLTFVVINISIIVYYLYYTVIF